MTTISAKLLLSPQESVILVEVAEAYLTTEASSTHQRDLATILGREMVGLKDEVVGSRRKLLELELVDAGGSEGQKDERGESGEDHGGSTVGWGATRGESVTQASLYDRRRL